jgi:phosphoglycerol transferase MdoB-like AlkP superfamily enzyme
MAPEAIDTRPRRVIRLIGRVARTHAVSIGVLSGCLVLLMLSRSDRGLAYVNRLPSVYSAAFSVGLFALILPLRFVALSVPLAAGLVFWFGWVNHLKMAAVALPVTFLDARLLITRPEIVFNALGVTLPTAPEVGGLAAAVAVLATVILVWRLRAHSPRFAAFGRRASVVVIRLATAFVLYAAMATCLRHYGTFVQERLAALYPELSQDLWTPESQASLVHRLGVLEYIAFTYAAGDGSQPIASGHAWTAERDQVRKAVREVVNTGSRYIPRLAPNIVFFHAESTFDPNEVFKLSERVDLPLWSPARATRSAGPLRVNVIGGGSWVTEFEVLTGIDSRVFGYQGFYTHQYLAPMVKYSFPKYLARKGYHTAVYYPIEGSFYNAAAAFGSYGMQDFIDGPTLGMPADWGQIVDRDLITAIIGHGAFERPGPFFYFISTTENHGPHYCPNEAAPPLYRVRFLAAASAEQTCTLHEYLRRARSTSDAFERVAAELREIEKRTGRPYVLVAYGDHQPWSFTDGRYSVAGTVAAESGVRDYSAVRRLADDHITFFHVQASTSGIVKARRFVNPPPVTLLPTLASAFVAASEDDLYIPLNFLMYSTCGSDFRRPGCELYPQILGSLSDTLLTSPTPTATTGSIDN